MIHILLKIDQMEKDPAGKINMIIKDQEIDTIQEDLVQEAIEDLVPKIADIIEAVAETATGVQVDKDGMKEELQDQDLDPASEIMSEK